MTTIEPLLLVGVFMAVAGAALAMLLGAWELVDRRDLKRRRLRDIEAGVWADRKAQRHHDAAREAMRQK